MARTSFAYLRTSSLTPSPPTDPLPDPAYVPQCIKTGKFMAIKCMKTTFPSVDQVNNLREIQALRRLSPHPNIVKLEEVL